MDPLRQTSEAHEKVLMLVLRGVLAGVLAVIAIAVWAINVEAAFRGGDGQSLLGSLLRLILCDAIPLAALVAIYQAVGRSHSSEGLVRSILGSMLFWRRHARNDGPAEWGLRQER